MAGTSLFLALVALLLCLRLGTGLPAGIEEGTICDNGKFNIDSDGVASDECDVKWQISSFLRPAGHSECASGPVQEPSYLCMDTAITYKEPIPSSGDFRPLAPKYGEYRFLPPQRWLHSLHRGAVAFLYHPCADAGEVASLKSLARSCLWRHIIAPSTHLNSDYSSNLAQVGPLDLHPLLVMAPTPARVEDLFRGRVTSPGTAAFVVSQAWRAKDPMAMVAWGCVYRMRWVDTSEARAWLVQHAGTFESGSTDGIFEEKLLHRAAIVTSVQDAVICPGHPHQPTRPTLPPGHSHPDTSEPTSESPVPANTPQSPDFQPNPTISTLPDAGSHPAGDSTPHDHSPSLDHFPSPDSPPSSPSDPSSPPSPSDHPPGPPSGSDYPASWDDDVAPSPAWPSDGIQPPVNPDCAGGLTASPTPERWSTNEQGLYHLPCPRPTQRRRPAFSIAMVMLSFVVLCIVSVLAYQLCYRGRRKGRGRYKAVSRFIPLSHEVKGHEQVMIPEFGLPRAVPSEREKLLSESDEEEL